MQQRNYIVPYHNITYYFEHNPIWNKWLKILNSKYRCNFQHFFCVDNLILQLEKFLPLSFNLQISSINNFISYPLGKNASILHLIYVIPTIQKHFPNIHIVQIYTRMNNTLFLAPTLPPLVSYDNISKWPTTLGVWF